MNDFGNPIRMVRELKGPALSIFMALALVHQRVSQSWLEIATGYTDKSVSKALAYLEEAGLANHTSAGWQLTGQAKQLPLASALEMGEQETENSANEEPREQEDNSDLDNPSRRNSDSTSSRVLKESIKDSISTISSQDRRNSDSGDEQSGKIADRITAVKEALMAEEIGEPALSLLLGSQVLTADWVKAWAEQLKLRYQEKYQTGLLVHVLSSGRQPKKKYRPDRNSEEGRQKYKDWNND